MRRHIMLFLFQGCLRLSFKNWTGLQDYRIYRIYRIKGALTMDRIAGLQDLQERLFLNLAGS